MPIGILLPGYVAEVFAGDAFGLGQMQAVMAGGALLGAVMVAAVDLATRRGRVLVLCAAGVDLALLAFSATGVFVVAAVLLLGVGATNTARTAFEQTLIQHYVVDEYRGRVTALSTMQFSLMSVGTFAGGLYAEALGLRLAIASLGLLLLASASAFLAFVPRLRGLD